MAGALLVALAGFLAWQLPALQFLSNASYDLLFRFGASAPTNRVVVVQLDDASAQALGTTRENWDRGLHARLLDKLTAGGCPLVVFDIHFERERDAATDQRLAEAIRRHGGVVLMARWTEVASPGMQADTPLLPHQRFLEAATNWGIGKLDDAGAPVRRHWPFPAPIAGRPSLPWTAAALAGARLDKVPREQWVRYYGEQGGVELVAYSVALDMAPEFFRGKVVFVGSKPRQPNPDTYEEDKFPTPYTALNGQAVGGVEILAVEFLNLVNGDWLRRLPSAVEVLLLLAHGSLLGVAASRLRGKTLGWLVLGAAPVLALGGVLGSRVTDYWFPWLIPVVAQLPCALAWSAWMRAAQPKPAPVAVPTPAPASLPAKEDPIPVAAPASAGSVGPEIGTTIAIDIIDWFSKDDPLPDAPEYELLDPPIGKGTFGKVWIVRNAIGQWQALKAIYASSFKGNRKPYEAEFKGVQRYKPVSEKHPGLLRIELVSRMKDEGYFYYVMELGDAQSPGWEDQPQRYKPLDLENLRRQSEGQRLPVRECVRIVTVLADALSFLHEQGLTHRDIKPANVIFVQGRPKLADIGLVAEIRPLDQVNTFAGTPGYMPPPTEKPGTPQADIYALGMLLYVISTGRAPTFFPELSSTLMEGPGEAQFSALNGIILKACEPDLARRYPTAADLLKDLRQLATQA